MLRNRVFQNTKQLQDKTRIHRDLYQILILYENSLKLLDHDESRVRKGSGELMANCLLKMASQGTDTIGKISSFIDFELYFASSWKKNWNRHITTLSSWLSAIWSEIQAQRRSLKMKKFAKKLSKAKLSVGKLRSKFFTSLPVGDTWRLQWPLSNGFLKWTSNQENWSKFCRNFTNFYSFWPMERPSNERSFRSHRWMLSTFKPIYPWKFVLYFERCFGRDPKLASWTYRSFCCSDLQGKSAQILYF